MIGGVYALMGIGLTLIFGIMNVVNFAHGEFYMFGAYMTYTFAVLLGVPFVPALLASALTLAVFGAVVERTLIRPVRHHPADVSMLILVGLSIFMANMVLVIWGPYGLGIDVPIPLAAVPIGPVTVTPLRVFVLAAAVGLIIASHTFLYRTKLGRAMRATFQDRDAAALMGINIDRMNMTTFALGAALAAIAGGLLGPIFWLLPTMGFVAVTKSFAVVVVGGLGSFPGAIVAGLLLGVVESLGAGYISSGYRDAIGFVLIILVLLVKPTGLFGIVRRVA